MSVNFDEKTFKAFFENTRNAILNLDRRVRALNERTETSFEVSEDAIRGMVAKYVGDGNAEVNKKVSTFEQTAESIRTEVKRVQQSAIASVSQQYYLSDSALTLTGGAWQTSPPAWQEGKYIWVRSVITQANGEVTYDSPVCITGNTGATGETGAGGDGIQSYTAYYKLGSSATDKPGSPSTSWSTTPPTVTTDTYLWVAYLVTYTSGNTAWTEPYCATDAIARGEVKALSSRIEQLADSITLEVTDGSTSGTASIVLKVDGSTAGSGTIDMSGIVKFKSFLNDSETKIDGGMVELDSLFAQNITATGSFQVNNGKYAIVQNTDGVTIKNVQDDPLQTSSITLGSGKMTLESLLTNLVATYRGFTGKVSVGYDNVSLLAYCNGQYADAYSYGIDVNDYGITVTGPLNLSDVPTMSSNPISYSQTSSLSLSSGGWQSVRTLSLSAGTYIITGGINVSSQGHSFSTRINIGGTSDSYEQLGTRNSVYCGESGLYYSPQSVSLVRLTSASTCYLMVYSGVSVSDSYGRAYLNALKIYN